ncbi:hypothetical protein [Streptomyces misionensis]|uniref:hypothetical protein n=1 Tax=Streptomyces misionensis TaxID=67331 RepID=UPI00396BC365
MNQPDPTAAHSCGNCDGIDPDTCLANPNRPSADPTAAPTGWIDGHPQLEAIAAAVWERCGRSDSGACVEDDPRNIAVAALAAILSVLPEPADAASRLSEVERRMLEYALDLADDEIARDGSEFSDDEEDAVAELRRLAGEQPAKEA